MFHIERVPAPLIIVVSLFAVTVAATERDVIPVGRMSHEQMLSVATQWRTTTPAAKSDCVDAFRHRSRRAVVRVFFGTWCDDSRYEVSRFLGLVRTLGNQAPFTVEFFAVDKDKREPHEQLRANRVSDLPTFIVFRNGREVGRIVSHPTTTVEHDLLRLLDGTAHGLLSSDEGAIVRFFASTSPQ